MQQVHATAITIGADGVLLTGESGAGKSDLALRLIEDGAQLVADDRCDLEHRDGTLIARAPASLAGMIEVRGVGIIVLPHTDTCAVRLVCELCDRAQVDRLPDARQETIADVAVPAMRVYAFEPSAPIKVRRMLDVVTGRLRSAT